MGDERNILVLAVRPACDRWLTDQASARGLSRADIVEELVASAKHPMKKTGTKLERIPSYGESDSVKKR